MRKPKLRLDRLSTLEKHIRKGKLGHKKFDFSLINDIEYNDGDDTYLCSDDNICGTMGCALGEAPIVFSNCWKFSGNEVILKRNSSGYASEDAAKFFGLTEDEVNHLFYPEQQMVGAFCKKHLKGTATREQVADNIKRFISIKKFLIKNGVI